MREALIVLGIITLAVSGCAGGNADGSKGGATTGPTVSVTCAQASNTSSVGDTTVDVNCDKPVNSHNVTNPPAEPEG